MALNETDLLAKVPTGLYIGGKWVQGHGEKPISVEDPATGKILLEIANADASDGLAALSAAHETQATWAKVPPRERAELLRRTFELVRERSEEFAAIVQHFLTPSLGSMQHCCAVSNLGMVHVFQVPPPCANAIFDSI